MQDSARHKGLPHGPVQKLSGRRKGRLRREPCTQYATQQE
jgi:hypothetical protein